MKISVVTGTYNRRPILPGLVADIFADSSVSHDSMELVLVDGGSSDGTVEYIETLLATSLPVKFVQRGKRSSYGDYMNAGIEASTGDYIAQWNDDVVLTVPWARVFDELHSNDDLYLFSVINSNDPAPKLFYNEFFKCMNFGLYKRDVFRDIGMYDDKSFDYYMADSDMTVRAWHLGKRIRTCGHVLVRELTTAKKAVGSDFEPQRYWHNARKYYYGKKVPPWIRKLEH